MAIPDGSAASKETRMQQRIDDFLVTLARRYAALSLVW